MKILFLQPRHCYAPTPGSGPGHIFMPTSLLSAAARVISAGIDVSIADDNLFISSLDADILGLNLVGPPYIPIAKEYISRARKIKPDVKVILGGQVMNGLTSDQVSELFGANAYCGNDPSELAEALGISTTSLAPAEQQSLIPAYKRLKDHDLDTYLNNEFAFYLSQGCKHRCTFCAAERTRQRMGRLVRVKETYRCHDAVSADLEFLFRTADRLGISRLKLYLSNLDLFQSPKQLFEFAKLALERRSSYPGIELNMRALSNVNSFLYAHRHTPEIIRTLASAGMTRIGFGVDGASSSVWKAVKKPHGGPHSQPVDAIRICRSEYGITPEALMVFGHWGSDTPDTLRMSVEFLVKMKADYGAIPRPHVAKHLVPGSDGWLGDDNKSTVRFLLKNPRAFQLLDYTGLATLLTHHNEDFCSEVNSRFIEACDIEGSITRYVFPEYDIKRNRVIPESIKNNRGKFDI